jgi:hypothetical protein
VGKRYDSATVRTDDNGNRIFGSVIYPDVQPQPEDVVITAESGTRLDELAFQYYNDAKLWWIIAVANQLGRGSLEVEAGTRVRIPQGISNVLNEYQRLNQRR